MDRYRSLLVRHHVKRRAPFRITGCGNSPIYKEWLGRMYFEDRVFRKGHRHQALAWCAADAAGHQVTQQADAAGHQVTQQVRAADVAGSCSRCRRSPGHQVTPGSCRSSVRAVDAVGHQVTQQVRTADVSGSQVTQKFCPVDAAGHRVTQQVCAETTEGPKTPPQVATMPDQEKGVTAQQSSELGHRMDVLAQAFAADPHDSR